MQKNCLHRSVLFALLGAGVLWGSHTFESADGYEAGSLSGQAGWSGVGSVTESADAPQGTRVLSAGESGATLAVNAIGGDVLYADLWLKISSATQTLTPLMQLGGAQLGFAETALGYGNFYVQTGADEWRMAGDALPLFSGASDWVRVTAFLDYSQEPPVWDFYTDGEIAAEEIPLDAAILPIGLVLQNAQADDVSAGDFDLLLSAEDSQDNSGIASMRNGGGAALSGLSLANAALALSVANESASAEESMAAPSRSGSASATYYVNPAIGSDSYDGLSASVSGTSGPKATLPAAITAATSGDTILLSASTHTLSATLSGGSKTLTLAAQSATATISGN